jgi:acyl-CoA thioesterase-2
MIEVANPQDLVDRLAALLLVEPLGRDVFQGAGAPETGETGTGRVYGGQLIAQALAAAEATVREDRLPHSLHAYFLRMGDFRQPIRYEVERDLDGGSFANRRVVALQGDRRLLSMSISFHRLEESVHHQDPMPTVAAPESLTSRVAQTRTHLELLPQQRLSQMAAIQAIEQRPVEGIDLTDPAEGPPQMHIWLRATAPLGDDPRVHRAFLVHASDAPMLPTASRPHGLSWSRGDFQGASLDHAIWFHEDFRMDDWLLYETHSSWAGRGRGHIAGKIYRRDGLLVASIVQEGMIRRL